MTNDQQALFDKARASIGAAGTLLAEGYTDFAPARAYYAMFYVAEALLARIGQSYSKHSAVIAAFGREYAKTGKLDPKYHRWLIDAQDLRGIGDYGVSTHITSEQAKDAISWATALIDEAEALTP